MNWQMVSIAGYELTVSLIFGLLTVFIAVRVLTLTFYRTAKTNLLDESNLAASVFTGTLILCLLIMVRGCIAPSVDMLQAMRMSYAVIDGGMVLTAFGYFLAFYSLGLAMSLGMILITLKIYMVATTRVNEVEELKRGNVAVAVMLSTVLLGMSLFVQQPLTRLIASLVDYDALAFTSSPSPSPFPSGGSDALDVMEVPVQPVMPERSTGQE